MLRNWLKRNPSKRVPYQKARLGVEGLEDRNLMSVSVMGSTDGIFENKDWTMKIIGDSNDNAITVQWDKKDPLTAYDDELVVRDHGLFVGSVKPWEGNFGYKGVNITKIRFEGKEGNDRFEVIGSLQVYPEGYSDFDPSGKISIEAYGGKGDDVLIGTHDDTNDLLDGGTGNDTLWGLGGNDKLFGGDGNDHIYGGAGDDYIEGGLGNDLLNGESGNDTVYGDVSKEQAGVFYIYDAMNGGKDTINGNDGDDVLVGNGGDDTIKGGEGKDKIYGDALDNDNQFEVGSDTIYGDSDNSVGYSDTIYGGRGNDYINSGAGNDFVYAGKGNDIIYGMAGSDDLQGQDGNDAIYAGDGNDSLDGGIGIDLLWGDKGNDTMFGGAGNDTMYGGDGNDGMSGGDGDDIMHGGNDNDIMYGDKGKDQLFGENGSDYLKGGSSQGPDGYADTLDGGNGADTFFVDYVALQNNQWYNRDKPLLFFPNEDKLTFN